MVTRSSNSSGRRCRPATGDREFCHAQAPLGRGGRSAGRTTLSRWTCCAAGLSTVDRIVGCLCRPCLWRSRGRHVAIAIRTPAPGRVDIFGMADDFGEEPAGGSEKVRVGQPDSELEARARTAGAVRAAHPQALRREPDDVLDVACRMFVAPPQVSQQQHLGVQDGHEVLAGSAESD
jgi:hypothetical protein